MQSQRDIARLMALALVAGWFTSTTHSLCAFQEGQTDEGEIRVDSSRVYVFVGKVGLGHEHAIIGQLKSGAVQLGSTNKAGEIVFDMSTFTADTDEARQYIGLEGTTAAGRRKEATDNMLGTSVLNVRKFPTATFKIASTPHNAAP